MAQTADQQRATQAVAAWLAAHGRNNAWLVAKTGLDSGTVGDFLNGKRWPKIGNQGKVERALGWEPGTIRAVANGDPPPPVGGDDQDASYVAAPGDRVDDPNNITMADLMSEIRAVRRELDEIKRRRGEPRP